MLKSQNQGTKSFRVKNNTHKSSRRKWNRTIRIFVWLGIEIVLVTCIIIGLWSWYYIKHISATIPSLDKLLLYNPPRTTIMYDSDREQICEIAKENRIFVQIEDVPEQLKNAFIAAEDKSFYTNPGVDLYGLAKAIVKNFINTIRVSDDRYIGASTITQQVVRNVLLSNERTIARKLKEFIIAREVAKILPKERILEIYLNHIYLGSRTYGVVAAAQEYFGKTLHELTIDEMAVLASLPKAPSVIDPTKNINRAMERRNWVLKRMFIEKYITESELLSAKQRDIILRKKNDDNFGWAFMEYVKNQMIKSGITEEKISTDGYVVTTTMKQSWQQISQKALDNGIVRYDRRHGYRGPITRISVDENWCQAFRTISTPAKIASYSMALVLQVDKKFAKIGLHNCTTGTIDIAGVAWAKKYISKSMIGPDIKSVNEVLHVGDVIAVQQKNNNNFNLEQIPEIDGSVIIMRPNGAIASMIGGYADIPGTFNRATNAERQPGSTIKPFVYLAGLDRNLLPSDIFIDAEISFNLAQGQVWKPRNSSRQYMGAITLRTGLEQSINVITLRIAETIGLNAIISMLNRMNISHPKEPNFSIVLGTSETTLLRLVTAYSAIANYGRIVKPYAIQTVALDDKIITMENTAETDKDSVNRDFLDMLFAKMHINEEEDKIDNDNNVIANEDNPNDDVVVSPESAYQIISILKGSVLRGTSNDAKLLSMPLAGKTGTSQDGESLWFVGFTPDVIIGIYVGYDQPRSTGREFGRTAALPIFVDIMSKIKTDLSNKEFRIPKGISLVKIDAVTGKRTNKPIGGNIIYEAFKTNGRMPPFENESPSQQKENDVFDEVNFSDTY